MRFAFCFAPLLAVACGGAAKPRPTVALVVNGERAAEVERAAIATDLGVELKPTALPKAPARSEKAGAIEQTLADARGDYMSGELARVRDCAERLGPPDLVWSALARRDRKLAARLLVWRMACSSIARKDDAADAARTFAALGLEPPTEIDAIPVEAHRILSAALKSAEGTAKRSLEVKSRVTPSLVFLDGRWACTTPCKVDVAPGDHHVSVERDGMTPAARVVRIAADAPSTSIGFEPPPASPEIAATQWTIAYGEKSTHTDDADALVLLSTAVRARRLVYLDGERLGDGTRVRGAVVVDGRVEARSEQRGSADKSTRDALEDLLVKGGIVESSSIFTKPLFWIAVGAAIAGSAGLTAYLLSDPGTRTEVRTR